MKVEVNENGVMVLSEVFNSIIIKTQEGKELAICLRDYGFDVKLDNGKWAHISEELDLPSRDLT